MKPRRLFPLGLAATAILLAGCGWFGHSRDVGPAPEIEVKEERPVDSPGAGDGHEPDEERTPVEIQ